MRRRTKPSSSTAPALARSGNHISYEMLNAAIGVKVTHVPYRDIGPLTQDMIALLHRLPVPAPRNHDPSDPDPQGHRHRDARQRTPYGPAGSPSVQEQGSASKPQQPATPKARPS